MVFVKDLPVGYDLNKLPYKVIFRRKHILRLVIEYKDLATAQSAIDKLTQEGITATYSKFKTLDQYLQYKQLRPYHKMCHTYGERKVQHTINVIVREGNSWLSRRSYTISGMLEMWNYV